MKSVEADNIINSLESIIKYYQVNKKEINFPLTYIYNEEWLLKILLEEWYNSGKSSSFNFIKCQKRDGLRIFSEGQIPTPFVKKVCSDKKENNTHADGILGHFDVIKKSRIKLIPDFSFISIIEAKIFSDLSKGVTNKQDYNQVSRTIACLINLIMETKVRNGYEAFFTVIYPESNHRIQSSKFNKKSIYEGIKKRLDDCTVNPWDDDWIEIYNSISVQFVTLEEIIKEINEPRLDSFYKSCLIYNKNA